MRVLLAGIIQRKQSHCDGGGGLKELAHTFVRADNSKMQGAVRELEIQKELMSQS